MLNNLKFKNNFFTKIFAFYPFTIKKLYLKYSLRLLTNKKLSAVFLFCCLCDNISVVVDDFVPSVQTLRLHDFFV